jgi:hypothetical protein
LLQRVGDLTRVEVVFKLVGALGHRLLPNLLLTTLCKSFLGWLIAALNIVAALLDDEATVKTFKKRDGHVWLMPHNPSYEPIAGDHATIMGKVVSVLRKI